MLLPAVVADLILEQLHRGGHSPFVPALMQPLGLPLYFSLMWRGRMRDTFLERTRATTTGQEADAAQHQPLGAWQHRVRVASGRPSRWI